MSIKNQEINEFFNEDLSQMNKNNINNETNINGKKDQDSLRSSLNLEKINYFTDLKDNENLKQNFLNDNLFPLEIVGQQYAPSIQEPMIIKDLIKSALYLGISNFDVMQVKEKKHFYIL